MRKGIPTIAAVQMKPIHEKHKDLPAMIEEEVTK